MHGNYGYFEEDHLGKAYDWPLWRRLTHYGRPYLRLILLSALFILAVTAADLILPYLLKIGIDRSILPSARELLQAGRPSPEMESVLAQIGTPPGLAREGERLFVPEEGLRRLDPQLLQRLQNQGVLGSNRIYYTRLESATQREVVDVHPEFFRVVGGWAYIDYEDLDKLNSSALLRLRRADMNLLWTLGLVFVAVLLVSAASTFGLSLAMVKAGQLMMHDLRMKLFTHLQRMALSFFDRQPVGRLVTRLTNDIQNLDEMFSTVIMTLFKDGVVVCGILMVLFYLDWRLTMVSLSVMPLVFLLFHLFGVQVRGAFREIRAKLARINATLNEYLSGIRVIQLFQQEAETFRRFHQLNHDYYETTLRQITIQAIFFPCIELLATTTTGLLLWYGGGQVIRERLSLGALVAFLSYVRMFFGPVRDLSQKYSIMQSAMASAERVFHLLGKRDQEEPSRESPKRPPAVSGEIEFHRVTFAYGDGESVLDKISFRVEPGETLAIVGVTGAGKTTLIHLLERFYEPQDGTILLDGQDVRSLDLSWLRQQVALIMQDVFLFAGSLRENIILDRRVSPEELERIVRYAQLEEVVARLPGGLDATVHEGGVTLSMGERQLLAIARAMAYNPKVLVLDEATANIDSETEYRIQRALERLFEGRTTLVIAHRLSTIQKAHRILVLHRGQIVESGSHGELLALRNFYYRLHQLQFSHSLVPAD
jgi:ATP-binding cassette subfamily B multidrug efflux pump